MSVSKRPLMARPARLASKLTIATFLSILAIAVSANAQLLFEDEFSGDALDISKWKFHPVYLNPTQTRDCAHADALEFTGDTVKLPLETYNPTANVPGDSFYGTDIRSKLRFDRGNGLVLKTRMRIVDDGQNPLAQGIVGGFFLFETDPVVPGVVDEIDFEHLSNDIDSLKNGDESKRRVLTNVFDDYDNNDPGLNPGKPVFVSLPGVDLTNFNDFAIHWLPERVEWYVNGDLRRTEHMVVPNDAMDVHFNIHAPGSGFQDAYDPNLEPTPDPNENRTFFLEIDYVTVNRIPEPSTMTLLLFGAIALMGIRVWTRRRKSRA